MIQAEFERFSRDITALAEMYSRSMSPGLITLWWEALKRFDYEQVNKALALHSTNPESGQFMPKPADLIRHMEGTATDKSMIAWGKAFDAAQRVGAYNDVVFDDPVIHAVIEDLGGWVKFCRSETAEISYLQHRFTESYRAYANRQGFDYPRKLIGDRSSDFEFQKFGMKPPKPAIVGSTEAARLVYRGGQQGSGKAVSLPMLVERLEIGLNASNVEAA